MIRLPNIAVSPSSAQNSGWASPASSSHASSAAGNTHGHSISSRQRALRPASPAIVRLRGPATHGMLFKELCHDGSESCERSIECRRSLGAPAMANRVVFGGGMGRIKIAIAGVGNCASSLVQGLHYYGRKQAEDAIGLLHWEIGGYRPQ